MKQQKMLNTNKGITLIALVITIIVMLILVAVSISMAVNGGLFEYAGRAGKETNNAIREEQQLASGKVTIDNKVYNSIDEYLDSQKGSSGNNAGGDIQGIDGEVFTAIYTETKPYEDENGDTAVIPKGFSVGKTDGINTIEDGLVIQDAKGNQFVWIPVEYTASGTTDEHGLDSGFIEVFKRRYDEYEYVEDFTEPYEDGYEGEVTEYYQMMLSVQTNRGFYIGRFEAGTEEPRYAGVENGTDEMIVKRDVYPYNMVGWGQNLNDYEGIIYGFYDELDQGYGAVYLSKHLLDGQTTGAVSTLCYGVQWDTVLEFIIDENDFNDDLGATGAVIWGNHANSNFTITRKTSKFSLLSKETYDLEEWVNVPNEGKIDTNSDEMLLTTGASDEFASKNIYDIVGNVAEWTMEVWYERCRLYRGDHFRGYGDPYLRGDDDYPEPNMPWVLQGFRPALYIK